jgi:hypothetical protein
MRHEADRRRLRRRVDDPGRGRQALLGGRRRLEGGTPEVPGGHTRCYEQAKPQRIEWDPHAHKYQAS